MDWYKRYPLDYRTATYGLTLEEHGAYNLLIDHYMLTEEPIPADDKSIAAILGVAVDNWVDIKEAVLAHFDATGDVFTNERCDKELTVFIEYMKKARSSGR